MDGRRLLHPLPLSLIVIFLSVAVGDLVRKVGEEPAPPPELMGPRVPNFEPREPAIDFRPVSLDREVELLPLPVPAEGEWSKPERRGTWARGPTAAFSVDLTAGGHRALVVEGMPAGGKTPIRSMTVTVNGIDCGRMSVEEGWSRYLFEIPPGVVRSGDNRIVFGFPDRERVAVSRRALLVRRVALLLDWTGEDKALFEGRAVTVDLEAERLTVRRSGTFELPIKLDDRTDALQLRYRLPSGSGRAVVVVAKRRAEGAGDDEVARSAVDGELDPSGRVRIPLHGRRGAFVLRISADLGGSAGPLVISSLRLVEEGDPNRRPWAADPNPS